MARKKNEGKETRRARGTGSVFFDARRGVWVGRKIVGKRLDGKPKYVERSHAEQAEMLRLLEKAGPPDPACTVAEWCDRWLTEMAVRPRTRKIREGVVANHVKPTVGPVALRALSVYQVNQMVAAWLAAGLNPNTVKTYLSAFRACMEAARDAGLRPDNPVARAKAPAPEPVEIDPFTPAEVRRVVAEAGKSPTTRALVLLAVTGCRAGEALALDRESFDPATGRVTIRQTWDSDRRELGPPKSARGNRTLRVPRPGLAALRAAHAAALPGGPLFPSLAGRRSVYPNLFQAFGRLLARLAIRPRGTHQFRHTMATRLLADGVSVGDVAKFLGDTPESIMRSYCHATDADVSAAAERVLAGGAGARKGAA